MLETVPKFNSKLISSKWYNQETLILLEILLAIIVPTFRMGKENLEFFLIHVDATAGNLSSNNS
jgi:hypothetical protein